jgi:TfdA family taurine catabolism dioxygenase TauD
VVRPHVPVDFPEDETIMTVDAGKAVQAAHVIRLTEDEKFELEIVAAHLAERAPRLVDDLVWVDFARDLAAHLPIKLRQTARRFIADAGPDAMLLLRNLPLESAGGLPDTPSRKGSVQRTSAMPAAVLVLIGFLLGEPFAFAEEKSGALVQDVVPVPGMEEFQGNAGSTTLTMHIENAFHADRPDYVGLLCLRSDHDKVAGLQIASIRNALPLLSDATRETLFEAQYLTDAPGSFGDVSGVSEPHGILSGAWEDPDIKVDFFSTKPLTAEAGQAMARLDEALRETRHTLLLEHGDLAFVDNRLALHGRTEFTPRYDGRDRWLQRIFVSDDIRRSRRLRLNDGHVLAGS